MKLLVYNGEQKQEHLPVPLGVTRPQLVKLTPNFFVVTIIRKYEHKWENKGTLVDTFA